jgi:hypothetical protein
VREREREKEFECGWAVEGGGRETVRYNVCDYAHGDLFPSFFSRSAAFNDAGTKLGTHISSSGAWKSDVRRLSCRKTSLRKLRGEKKPSVNLGPRD